jgi:exodeoxyribonuclease VII large subunit
MLRASGEEAPVHDTTSTITLTPASFHAGVAAALDEADLGSAWVIGTVTGLRAGPRFTSFELVDYDRGGNVVATLSAGMFAREAAAVCARLERAGSPLREGIEVRVHGMVDVNAAFGRLRLLVDDVDSRVSLGAATAARQDLLERLHRDGSLERQLRLVVTASPRRVGLVTAAGGAGRADFLELLGEGSASVAVVEEQVPMSGATAGSAFAASLERLARRGVDVIVVARGGGQRSDLASWDTEVVARAIAGCPVPVWTAIGHATDETVADRVANQVFPTPSSAASALVARTVAATRAADVALAEGDSAELARARRRVRVLVAAVVVLTLLLLLVR